jgi:hypothetical protein
MSDDPKARGWARESDNWYPEPCWVTRRLCDAEQFEGRTVDPCAGMGNTLHGAREAGTIIEGMDLRDRGNPLVTAGHDFFADPRCHGIWPCDNIISNPPYGSGGPGQPRLEEQFLTRALARARRKVALFLPAGWVISAKRNAWLETLPLYRIYFVSPRPSCPPGQNIMAGEKAEGGKTDFSWVVFLHGFAGAPTVHFLRRDG